jgi:hypothetical protein
MPVRIDRFPKLFFVSFVLFVPFVLKFFCQIKSRLTNLSGAKTQGRRVGQAPSGMAMFPLGVLAWVRKSDCRSPFPVADLRDVVDVDFFVRGQLSAYPAFFRTATSFSRRFCKRSFSTSRS